MGVSAVALSTLAECEAVIERGLATFTEVGEALLRIRDGRLYRETHKTFEAYCRERWGMSKTHANRQIEAAEVGAALTPIGVVPSEAIARELAPLKDEPEEMAGAWREAQDRAPNGAPTAAVVRQVVQDRAIGPRVEGQQARMLGSISEKCSLISDVAAHVDLDALHQLPKEQREQWQQQLRSARTVLTRIIAAL